MQWRNTETHWGVVTKLFHWGMLLLFIAMFVLANTMDGMPKGPEKAAIIGLHKSIGITILLLAVLRLLWRISGKVPASLAPTRLLQCAAAAGHAMLYMLMIVMPLSGYVMSMSAGRGINWFGLGQVPDLIGPDESRADMAHDAHEIVAGVVLLMLVLHVLAALWHHFRLKDATLRRMLP